MKNNVFAVIAITTVAGIPEQQSTRHQQHLYKSIGTVPDIVCQIKKVVTPINVPGIFASSFFDRHFQPM
jgi:hypothetical protein